MDVVKMGNEELPSRFVKSQDRITKLKVDPNGVLWIVSEKGVFKYDESANELRTIQLFKTNDVFNIWRMYTGLILDHEGNMWLGKDLRGLYKHDGISDDFNLVPFGEEYSNKRNTYDYTIRAMLTDNTGIIWIGTFDRGLFKFDPASEPFLHYINEPDNPESISGNEIFGLFESKMYPGKIYVGTRGSGLNLFDSEKGKFKKIKLNFDQDIFGGSVRSIYETSSGKVYLGTWGDGLYLYTPRQGAKLISKYDSLNNASLSNNLVRILREDIDGKIWIGTNYGLCLYDPVHDRLKRFYTREDARYHQDLIDIIRSKTSGEKPLASILKVGDGKEIRQAFSIDRPRDYMVISVGEGSSSDSLQYDYGKIENESGSVFWNGQPSKNSMNLGGAGKNKIIVDVVRLTPGKYNLYYKSDGSHSFGNWNAQPPIDSLLWGIQILPVDGEESAEIKRLVDEAVSQPFFSGMNIRSIHLSKRSNNIIWVGTDNNGLDKYDKINKSVKNYRYDPDNANTLTDNSIQFIHEDKNGILWLATNAGLNRFDPVKEEFKSYMESDGLPTNYVASILEDDLGNFWISTRNGLSRANFSGERPTFVNYDANDGLGGSDYIAQVALKASNGKMYFGGDHGLNEFSPDRMNSNPPDLVITDVKISNRTISHVDDGNLIENSIFETDNITLSYFQNDLSFEFSALHFARAEKNQYAHFLDGYDKEWVYDNRKYASYTNLDPGEYKFTFKGSNSDGIWNNDGKSLKITILPPWWQTTYAYAGYVLIFAGVIFGVDRVQRRRLLSKAKERMRMQEAEYRAEAAELKAKAAEAERQMLQGENARKDKELEEARQLQLSMLPRELPELPNLDIAVYMKTATEVGGDYYDFHVGMDGTLTVVLGDATGHGMKAGTMVTTVKSMFNILAPNPDIVETFHEMTRCLKLMQLEKLSMCMTMLKITGSKLQMSAAGMPPVFLYKRDGRTIEEHIMKGMPLGTFSDFPYLMKECELAEGDTILITSDGFTELMNDDKELFGYKRTRNLFEENVDKDPEKIIEILNDEGSKWRNDKDPDDDVTFVVIKVK
jgi:serine phosphatase RsbU (regulator of sigma subunit)/ligand-binding sensor domain-containing protein